jgi:hypothetical protein
MKYLNSYETFESFDNDDINETSATGGPFIGGGMGYGSAASGLAGQTIGTNWASSKSSEPDEIAIPYNPSGVNRVFQKVPMRKSRSHGSNRDKKVKSFKDILFRRRQDFTKGEGETKQPKVMSYDNFAKDDMMTVKKDEGIATTVGAIGLAASSLLKPTMPKEVITKDPVKDTTTLVEQTNDGSIKEFADTIIEKYPNIVTNDEVGKSTLSVSLLENEFLAFKENKNLPELSLSDLDLLSKPQFPLHINYFFVRGLDTDNQPILMPILNLSYSKTVSLYGHDVQFNFTRITGVNTIGAKINF